MGNKKFKTAATATNSQAQTQPLITGLNVRDVFIRILYYTIGNNPHTYRIVKLVSKQWNECVNENKKQLVTDNDFDLALHAADGDIERIYKCTMRRCKIDKPYPTLAGSDLNMCSGKKCELNHREEMWSISRKVTPSIFSHHAESCLYYKFFVYVAKFATPESFTRIYPQAVFSDAVYKDHFDAAFIGAFSFRNIAILDWLPSYLLLYETREYEVFADSANIMLRLNHDDIAWKYVARLKEVRSNTVAIAMVVTVATHKRRYSFIERIADEFTGPNSDANATESMYRIKNIIRTCLTASAKPERGESQPGDVVAAHDLTDKILRRFVDNMDQITVPCIHESMFWIIRRLCTDLKYTKLFLAKVGQGIVAAHKTEAARVQSKHPDLSEWTTVTQTAVTELIRAICERGFHHPVTPEYEEVLEWLFSPESPLVAVQPLDWEWIKKAAGRDLPSRLEKFMPDYLKD